MVESIYLKKYEIFIFCQIFCLVKSFDIITQIRNEKFQQMCTPYLSSKFFFLIFTSSNRCYSIMTEINICTPRIAFANEFLRRRMHLCTVNTVQGDHRQESSIKWTQLVQPVSRLAGPTHTHTTDTSY